VIRLDRPNRALRLAIAVAVLLAPLVIVVAVHRPLPGWLRIVHFASFMTTFLMVNLSFRQAAFLTAAVLAGRAADTGYRQWVHDGWESWIVLACVGILAGYAGRRLLRPQCRV
jgi:hypothetical protein